MTEPLLRCDHLTMRFGGLTAIAPTLERYLHGPLDPNDRR